jgi:hypothetical protein
MIRHTNHEKNELQGMGNSCTEVLSTLYPMTVKVHNSMESSTPRGRLRLGTRMRIAFQCFRIWRGQLGEVRCEIGNFASEGSGRRGAAERKVEEEGRQKGWNDRS